MKPATVVYFKSGQSNKGHLGPLKSCTLQPFARFLALHFAHPKDLKDSLNILAEMGGNFIYESFDWSLLRQHGISTHWLPSAPGKKTSCGAILAHAKDKVTAFRQAIGIRLCSFKIGVTANPPSRFPLYIEKGYTSMWLIAMSSSIDLIHMLEAALISEFHKHVGCQNKACSGGEGALNRANPVCPPYFVYVTGGRADQFRRVG